ncbi:hypothetical protein HYV71_01285 [Candidatus Uhrbacteria bacterium]|nr:hypothetical protein [Candidatus Uhrbacteria bacterium]
MNVFLHNLEDYYDYWQSDVYARYMDRIGWSAIGEPRSYGYARRVGPVSFVKYILTDAEPNIASIRDAGHEHGMIYWAPWLRADIPRSWRAHSRFMYVHDWRQGVSVVDASYQDKWNVRARRNFRAFEKSGATVRFATREEYKAGLAAGLLPRDLICLFSRKIDALQSEPMAYFVVEYNKGIIGGLATLPYGAISGHISAFLTQEGKRLNAGTACINAWYRYALDNRIRYLNFGGVWAKGEPREWQGFSEFKRNFIDGELDLDRAYWKLF